MLLDSNILIYSVDPKFAVLREFLVTNRFAISAISRLEVLGYHRWSESQRIEMETMLNEFQTFPIAEDIIERAITLRQIRKMGLADSIIAATALVHSETLVTRNLADFHWVAGLKLINPLAP